MSLKDETGVLSAVIFCRDASKLTFRIRNGMMVEASGRIAVYEKGGSYSLQIRQIEPSGAGALDEKFRKLLEDLKERGMFDERYKKPVPAYCLKIGVVTAPTGAAIHDIISIAGRRNPFVQLILAPALVQGEGAAPSIARALGRLDAMGLDCIIVGRGGGSAEDLWAFNEEIVAEAVFTCETPVISAVGHETDITICDLVADVRAQTPSAAAELAVFPYDTFAKKKEHDLMMLDSRIDRKLAYAADQRSIRLLKLKALSPEKKMSDHKNRLRELLKSLDIAMDRRVATGNERKKRAEDMLGHLMTDKSRIAREGCSLRAARLDALSPLKRLAAGYAVAEKKGMRVRSVRDVEKGDDISIFLKDGVISAAVDSVIAARGIAES